MMPVRQSTSRNENERGDPPRAAAWSLRTQVLAMLACIAASWALLIALAYGAL